MTRRKVVAMNVRASRFSAATTLEDLPNIGRSIAADLRGSGIQTPEQLAAVDPLKTYLALSGQMGCRHDPCVLYTLLAACHFLHNGEVRSWWEFAGVGKALLVQQAEQGQAPE